MFQEFLIHESVIRSESPFFEAVLSRDWKEAKEKLVSLPQAAPDAFRIYVDWMYSRRIPWTPIADKKVDTKIARTNLLVRAYILGDILQDFDFQDAVLDALIDIPTKHDFLPMWQTRLGFENTPDGSPLRHYLVDLHVFDPKTLRWIDSENFQYTNEEALRFILQGSEKLKSEGLAVVAAPCERKDLCVYHVHKKSKAPCYKEKYGLWGACQCKLCLSSEYCSVSDVLVGRVKDKGNMAAQQSSLQRHKTWKERYIRRDEWGDERR